MWNTINNNCWCDEFQDEFASSLLAALTIPPSCCLPLRFWLLLFCRFLHGGGQRCAPLRRRHSQALGLLPFRCSRRPCQCFRQVSALPLDVRRGCSRRRWHSPAHAVGGPPLLFHGRQQAINLSLLLRSRNTLATLGLGFSEISMRTVHSRSDLVEIYPRTMRTEEATPVGYPVTTLPLLSNFPLFGLPARRRHETSCRRLGNLIQCQETTGQLG